MRVMSWVSLWFLRVLERLSIKVLSVSSKNSFSVDRVPIFSLLHQHLNDHSDMLQKNIRAFKIK